MLNEVGPDHSDISELRRLVRELLEHQHEVDQMLGTDPHAAVKDAAARMLDSVVRLSEYLAAGSPSRVTPGAALVVLLQALEDRDNGIVNSVLQPTEGRGGNYLHQGVIYARVNVALAVELLSRAGRGREEATKEVAELLGPGHRIFTGHRGERWRIVKRWRQDIASGDYPDAAEKFDRLLEAVLATISTISEEPSADDLVLRERRGWP
jgi:hypothetical protein